MGFVGFVVLLKHGSLDFFVLLMHRDLISNFSFLF